MATVLIKLFLILVAPIVLALGFIMVTPRILSIDDLAACDGPQQVSNTCNSADAIVAISGGDTDARAHEAITLYKQGWAPVIVFSGAALDRGMSNAAAMRRLALEMQVPSSAIMLDEKSVNTADNASQMWPIVEQKGFKRIILITSPYHQRRASIEFNHRLGDIATIVNHPTHADTYWPARTWWETPWGVWLGISELVKVMVVSLSHA